MKWTNKGHQYDDIGKLFENVENVYIYGAGAGGKYLFELLEFLDCVTAFIDFDEQKQKNGFMNKPVLSFQKFLALDRGKSIIIISPSDDLLIKTNLIAYGFKAGIDFFDQRSFLWLYLPIFALYRYDKLYIRSSGLLTTERCTLQCKHCFVNVPNLENPQDTGFDEMISEIDTTFKRFDYVYDYALTGGEAALNPRLYDVIRYLLDSYSSKFHKLRILSNGFSNINGKLLDILRHPKVFVMWTNYLDNLTNEKISLSIKNNINSLKFAGVEVVEAKQTYWSDFKFGKITLEKSKEELTELFDNCAKCLWVTNNRLFPCIFTSVASTKVNGIQNFSVNLFDDVARQKYILMEAAFGFTPSGYVDGCRHCTSSMGIDGSRVAPGVQL